jgi:pyruvate formate lyase activating enzyme
MRTTPPTPPETLSRARHIALDNGLHYVYTGNVHDEAGGGTWCHGCGRRLIGRDWSVLTEWHLTPQGCCDSCGAPCPGVFEARPGTWGSRRAALRLSPTG